MAISRERKEHLVRQYVEQLQASGGVILADYRGLRVADLERLRRLLRDSQAGLEVTKNRLLRLALSQVGLQMPAEWLKGPVAVVFCHGEVPAAAKALSEFAKTTEFVVIKGGLVQASPISAEQVTTLAALPSREVLLAQVLGTINAPASHIAGVLISGIRQVLNVLQAYVDKLEGRSPAPQAA